MSYSSEFKINCNKLNQEDAILTLLEIDHPFISSVIRIVGDNKDFVFNGETYLAMPFSLRRQSDVQGELPKISLSLSNIGRSLVKWIDNSGGGRDAKITIKLARRSSPVVEESITLGIDSVSVTSKEVNFSLVIQNNLIKRAIRWTYDKDHAEGLF